MKFKVYRRNEVENITGLSRSTIYQLMSEDLFPKPIKLGRRAVGWRSDILEHWLLDKKTN